MKNLEGFYNSTYDFVEQNELQKQADECFGKDWEAEFDVIQIQDLISHLGIFNLAVDLIEDKDEDDIEVFKKGAYFSQDDINDISVKIVGDLVLLGIIKDCTDTDDETEFEAQDLIREILETYR